MLRFLILLPVLGAASRESVRVTALSAEVQADKTLNIGRDRLFNLPEYWFSNVKTGTNHTPTAIIAFTGILVCQETRPRNRGYRPL